MIKSDKELLLQDICSRLPYGIKIQRYDKRYTVDIINVDIENFSHLIETTDFKKEILKIYLRPMSDMTKDEKKKFDDFCVIDEEAWLGNPSGYINQAKIMSNGINYLNSIHVDYRGLIEKGLALPATKVMYD